LVIKLLQGSKKGSALVCDTKEQENVLKILIHYKLKKRPAVCIPAVIGYVFLPFLIMMSEVGEDKSILNSSCSIFISPCCYQHHS
jgi:hypothetical protein